MIFACDCLDQIGKTPKGACISPDEKYRYVLWRLWDERPLLFAVMLNPSTADASIDDRTIKKVVRFAKAWRYGGIVVANAFALRSRDPDDLRTPVHLCLVEHVDSLRGIVIGPENDRHLGALRERFGAPVIGWGTNIGDRLLRFRIAQIRAIIGGDATCLAHTKGGHPQHPLYVKGSKERERYQWPA